jgi:hypothetical protein
MLAAFKYSGMRNILLNELYGLSEEEAEIKELK